MGFDHARVVELVTEFYRDHGAEQGTSFVVVPNLDDGLRMADVHGPDPRMADVPVGLTARTVQELDADRRRLDGVHDLILRHVVRRDRIGLRARWLRHSTVISAASAGLPGPIGRAFGHGLGWLIAAGRTAILVPTPIVRFAERRTGIFHDDTGRMALVWRDGTGYYFLHGSEFDKRRYFQIINHELLIQDIAALDNADHRAIALQYLTFEQLVLDSDAELVDRGRRGTTLYRLELPARMARDRRPDHGGYDYFIHMRDASHPEREFVEWVDPRIGRQRNAELCQAHAFGISLDEWLAIEQEG